MVRKGSNTSSRSVSIPIEDDRNENEDNQCEFEHKTKTEDMDVGLDFVVMANTNATYVSDNLEENSNDKLDNEDADPYVDITSDIGNERDDNYDLMRKDDIVENPLGSEIQTIKTAVDKEESPCVQKDIDKGDSSLYDGYGILNKSFSTSTMEMNDVPHYELNKRSSYIYPVIVDDIEITSNSTTTKSTSLPDIHSRISVVSPTQKNCNCDCHSNHSNKSNHSSKRSPDAPSYYDVIATSSHHTNCHAAHDFILDFNQLRASPTGTPGNTPGRVRRKFPSNVVKMLNSRNPSPTFTTKGLPNYRSLIFSILKDEPPKYEDVTGKKLADELIGYNKDDRPPHPPGPGFVRNALKRRLIGIAALLVVIMFTFIVLYLSATIVGKRSSSSNADRKLN